MSVIVNKFDNNEFTEICRIKGARDGQVYECSGRFFYINLEGELCILDGADERKMGISAAKAFAVGCKLYVIDEDENIYVIYPEDFDASVDWNKVLIRADGGDEIFAQRVVTFATSAAIITSDGVYIHWNDFGNRLATKYTAWKFHSGEAIHAAEWGHTGTADMAFVLDDMTLSLYKLIEHDRPVFDKSYDDVLDFCVVYGYLYMLQNFNITVVHLHNRNHAPWNSGIKANKFVSTGEYGFALGDTNVYGFGQSVGTIGVGPYGAHVTMPAKMHGLFATPTKIFTSQIHLGTIILADEKIYQCAEKVKCLMKVGPIDDLVHFGDNIFVRLGHQVYKCDIDKKELVFHATARHIYADFDKFMLAS